MIRTRVIPVLLLKEGGLVKTVQFKDERYIGDPINAVRIFNDKEVDELIFLDITASKRGIQPSYDLIAGITSECFMPLCYGGGVDSVEVARRIFGSGVEKVCFNSALVVCPGEVEKTAREFGSQSVVASIDVTKSTIFGYRAFSHSGSKKIPYSLEEYLRFVSDLGVGEILVNSIDLDGTQKGYDLRLLSFVTSKVKVPVIGCGGAGSVEHFCEAINVANVSGVAAGSMFVYYGKHRAVLINVPSPTDLARLYV